MCDPFLKQVSLAVQRIYIGERNDFWEFNPGAQVADFEGGNRAYATGFSIRNNGYLGTGVFEFDVNFKDFWEFK